MIIDKIVNSYDKLYNTVLIAKKNIQTGSADNTFNPCLMMTNIFSTYNTNQLNDFKDNVNRKYFKDKIQSCIRKHISDTDNIKSLQDTICNYSIYNVIKDYYKLPNNIYWIGIYLSLIASGIYAIFFINLIIILLYIWNTTNQILSLIIFTFLAIVSFLIFYLSSSY